MSDVSVNSTSRWNFLQGGAAATIAMLASALLPKAAAQPPVKRPNLLFIYGEGHRADTLSLAGNALLKTPNMDRIGREGACFRNGFCTNSLCAPARATALTGMYPERALEAPGRTPDRDRR